ncbi:MAG: hypothetical protein ACLQGP_01545 [Isosphaeraceae bacterium]
MNEATIPVGPARASASLPRPIRRVLGRLGLRLRLASCLRGLGTTILVMALCAAMGMAADLAWVLPQLARWAIWGVWLAIGGLALILTALRPLVRRLGAFDLASVAERGHPELGERLTGAVALLGSGRAPHGSPSLIAALASEAIAESRTVKPARAVSWSRAARRLAGGILVLGSLVTPAFLWPDSYGALARRFVMPWADIDRIGRFVVTVTPGDKVLAVGSDLTVSASVRPLLGIGPTPDAAWLEWIPEGDASPQRIAMPPVTDADSTTPTDSSVGRFAFTLPRLGRSIEYRVVSGEATSQRHRITTLEPPSVASIAARVEPPSYTKLPTTIARDPARIDALEDSRITLDITPSRPVRSIEVGWPKPEGTKPVPIAAILTAGGRSGSATLAAEVSGPYTLALRDEYEIVNLPEPSRQVIVRPDAPPTVAHRGLEGVKEASPDDILTIAVAARDDIAVASIELHYAIRRGGSAEAGSEIGLVAVKSEGIGSRSARGAASMGFRPLGLKPGDGLTYRLRVADNRPAPRGPNVVWTSPEEIAIVAGAEPLMTQLGRLRRSTVQARLDALKKSVAANRQESERLRQSAEAARDGKAPWDRTRQQAVEHREADARAIIDQLKRFARDLDQDPRLRALARPARQIADLEAESGRAMLDRARQDDNPEHRLADLKQAANRLGAVGDRLEELQRKLNELSRDDARGGQLQALAARQQQIADEAENVVDRAQLDRLQARQNAVRNEVDTLIHEAPDLRGTLLQAEAKEAERLAREARALSDRQHEEARRAADPSRNAAELKALADAQRALEDDARRLALEVDPTLAENGRSRLNSEAIRQAADPIERGDIDQARQNLEGAENELRRLTRDIEDVPADSKALAGRLVHRQYALNNEIDEALRDVRNKDKLSPEEKAALNDRMKSLARREETIGRLARTIQPPAGKEGRSKFPHEAAREAVNKTTRAVEALGTLTPQVIEEGKNGARQALERLANDLPDHWRRQEPTRQKFDEARRTMNELSNQIAQHLRETEPRPDRPATAAKAAEELARRLNDAADRQAKAVAALEEMEPEPRVEPQRDRAVRRASALADVLKDLHDPSKREAARAALPLVEVRARAAMDRLEHKFNGRVPADDLADELADDQHRILQGLDDPKGNEAAGEDQRRLANALRNLNAPDATLAKTEAVRLAEHAARALTRADGKADPVAAVRAAAVAATNLADRLADRQTPQAQAEALARAERTLNQPEMQADPAQSEIRQKAIAAELARLPMDNKAEAAGRIEHASELAERAARIDDDRNGAGRPTNAALTEARRRAAEALDQLASRPVKADPAQKPSRTEPPVMADPELPLNPTQVATAKDLVRRERQIRERVQAVLGRHVEPQQAIRGEAVALGAALSELRDRIRPLSDRGPYTAFEAAHHLRTYAAQSMDQASEHLAQGQTPYARDDQRRASQMVDRGAQLAEDLAAALGAEQQAAQARAVAPNQALADGHPPIGEARAAMLRAGQQLDQAREPDQAGRAAQAAREAMREAARDLMAAAQAAAAQLDGPSLADDRADGESNSEPTPGTPAGTPTDPRSRPGTRAETDLTELKEAIRRKTGRAWGELPGHLRTEILQSSQGRYREEYARLIQLYFREIAAGAADRKPESGVAK